MFSYAGLGRGCNIGDQLEPSGILSKPVYDLIGDIYRRVEEKEPWCVGALPVSEIAVLVPEEFTGAGAGNLPGASQGACRLLQEGGYQFEFVDSKMDFGKYRLLILPDLIPVDKKLKEKLDRFMDGGGKIFLSHKAGLIKEKEGIREFALSRWGISYKGEAPYEPDFIVPKGRPEKGCLVWSM